MPSALIDKIVSREINRALDRLLPAAIERHLRKIFAEKPDMPLNKAGFGWAFYLAIKDIWPDVDHKTASKWVADYVDVPVGEPGYDWTPRAAKEMAALFAQEYGETA